MPLGQARLGSLGLQVLAARVPTPACRQTSPPPHQYGPGCFSPLSRSPTVHPTANLVHRLCPISLTSSTVTFLGFVRITSRILATDLRADHASMKSKGSNTERFGHIAALMMGLSDERSLALSTALVLKVLASEIDGRAAGSSRNETRIGHFSLWCEFS